MKIASNLVVMNPVNKIFKRVWLGWMVLLLTSVSVLLFFPIPLSPSMHVGARVFGLSYGVILGFAVGIPFMLIDKRNVRDGMIAKIPLKMQIIRFFVSLPLILFALYGGQALCINWLANGLERCDEFYPIATLGFLCGLLGPLILWAFLWEYKHKRSLYYK